MKKFVFMCSPSRFCSLRPLALRLALFRSMGKLEIVGTSEPAEAAAGGTEGEAESAEAESEAAAAPAEEPSAEATSTLDQQQMQELVEEEIVPQGSR